jgi:SAM-dependent methyltransferase
MDWDAHYQNSDTPWDKGAAAPPFVEWLEAWNALSPGSLADQHALVPGCGYGHDVRLLAAHGMLALGVDISPLAMERARQFGQVGAEMYRETDFLNLDRDLRDRFQFIFEHTLFCAIPVERRPDYVKSAARALRPGGCLVAIWYLDPVKEPDSADPPYGATLEEIEGLFGEAFELIGSWAPKEAFPGREGRERLEMWRKRSG